MLRPRALLVWLLLLGISACKKPYRVGEYVLVDWEEILPQLRASPVGFPTPTDRLRVRESQSEPIRQSRTTWLFLFRPAM